MEIDEYFDEKEQEMSGIDVREIMESITASRMTRDPMHAASTQALFHALSHPDHIVIIVESTHAEAIRQRDRVLSDIENSDFTFEEVGLVRETTGRLELENGSRIMFKGADSTGRLRGYRADLIYHSQVDSDIYWEILVPMTIVNNGTIVSI